MPSSFSSILQSFNKRFPQFSSEKGKRVLMFTIQMVIIIVVSMALLLFMRSFISKKIASILEMRGAIHTQEQRITALNQLKQEYRSVEDELPKVYGLLGDEQNLGENIVQLDSLLDFYALTGVTKINNKAEEDGVSVVPITVSMKSGFDTLKRYLAALEELPFLIKVTSIRFNGELNGVADVTLQLTLYLQ